MTGKPQPGRRMEGVPCARVRDLPSPAAYNSAKQASRATPAVITPPASPGLRPQGKMTAQQRWAQFKAQEARLKQEQAALVAQQGGANAAVAGGGGESPPNVARAAPRKVPSSPKIPRSM